MGSYSVQFIMIFLCRNYVDFKTVLCIEKQKISCPDLFFDFFFVLEFLQVIETSILCLFHDSYLLLGGGGCDDQFIVDYHRLSVWKYRIWRALMDSWTYCTGNILILIHTLYVKVKRKAEICKGRWILIGSQILLKATSPSNFDFV